MNRLHLLADLVALETELHQPATRRNRTRLRELLHDEFKEIGRPGAQYCRDEVLSALPEAVTEAAIWSDHFEIVMQTSHLVLLTYRSAQIGADGAATAHALRSSLWQRTGEMWQMRFHQGTPTPRFDMAPELRPREQPEGDVALGQPAAQPVVGPD